MTKLFMLSLFVLTSCTSPITKKDATSTFLENTNLSKDEAYTRTSSYLAKNLGKSNEAIQLKNQTNGKIVSRIGTQCNELRAFADITNYVVMYTLEADFKDKKARISLEGNSLIHNNIDGSIIAAGAELKENQKEGIHKCAIKIKDMLMESLNSQGTNW